MPEPAANASTISRGIQQHDDVFNYSPEELASIGPEAIPPGLMPEPTPLHQKPAVPPFPDSRCRPSSLTMCALAEATQTPVDMPASVALGSLSACVAGRATIAPTHGWTEPLCLYVVTAMEPGNRKSAVFSAITSPVREIEQELIETARPIIAEAEALKEVKEGELAG